MQWKNGVTSINDLQTAQGSIDPETYQTSAQVFQLK